MKPLRGPVLNAGDLVRDTERPAILARVVWARRARLRTYQNVRVQIVQGDTCGAFQTGSEFTSVNTCWSICGKP